MDGWVDGLVGGLNGCLSGFRDNTIHYTGVAFEWP